MLTSISPKLLSTTRLPDSSYMYLMFPQQKPTVLVLIFLRSLNENRIEFCKFLNLFSLSYTMLLSLSHTKN